MPVVVNPANPDVSIGGNTTIMCSVNSSVPVSQFVWSFNGRFLPANVMVRCIRTVVGVLSFVNLLGASL